MKRAEQAGPAVRELALRYGFDPGRERRLLALLEIVAGDERAPSAVRDPALAARTHIADSLVALELEQVRDAGTIADLGSGAGFPGLALAVALDAEVRLVESQARRCAFLERAIAVAGVGNAVVVHTRAEEWGEGAGVNDLVVARALAAPAVVLEYAAPLLRPGGALVDWRAARDWGQEDAALAAADVLGMSRLEIRRVQPFPEARERHLHVYLKVRDTPERFPRRAGMARKRPLAR